MIVTDELPPFPAPPPHPHQTRLARLAGNRIIWVLADQGVVSLGNFLTGLYLTRSLPQAEYGAYQVLLETMLYLNGLQNAVVIYPLLIKGATGDPENLGRLATVSAMLTVGLLPLLGGAIALSVGALDTWSLSIAAVLAMVLWQLQETMRRGLTADLRFFDAVWGDAISFLGQAGLVIWLAHAGRLDLHLTLIIMSATSAVAIILQAWQIGLKPVRIWQMRLIVRDFWRLGRWMLLSNATLAITTLGYTWTLLGSYGKESNAVFGAIQQAFKLANPVMSSMAGLITPAVARAAATDMKSATRSALRYGALGGAMLLPYFIVLLIFATPLLKWLSGPDKTYHEHADLLRLFVANYTMVYVLVVIGSWLAGLSRSRYNFYVQVVNIIATVAIGLPLTVVLGPMGLIIGGLISATLSAAAAAWFIYRLTQPPAGESGQPAGA